MGVRNRARKFLLQARYAAAMNGEPLAWNLDTLGLSDRFGPDERLWIAALGRAFDGDSERIDSLISASLENWSIERLELLTRLIIEQALAEVIHLGIDMPVAIDEAVELSREFGDDASASFVNGVLDRAMSSRNGP